MQWNITHLKKNEICNLQQHGWTCRVFIMLSEISQRNTV